MIFSIISIKSSAQTLETIPEGSFIIDMGISPQTDVNAVLPYGLIFTMLNDYNVPVKWIINESKSKDGIDFTYAGNDFRGGPFIIDGGLINAEVDSVIASWQAKGMVGMYTTEDLDLPVAMDLTSTVRWTLDLQNGAIAEAYINQAMDRADIEGDVYDWTLPTELNCCNNVFVMPHADPEWETHGNLLAWNDSKANGGCEGYIWSGCHAVSVLENVVNPADPTETMNFCNSLVPLIVRK